VSRNETATYLRGHVHHRLDRVRPARQRRAGVLLLGLGLICAGVAVLLVAIAPLPYTVARWAVVGGLAFVALALLFWAGARWMSAERHLSPGLKPTARHSRALGPTLRTMDTESIDAGRFRPYVNEGRFDE